MMCNNIRSLTCKQLNIADTAKKVSDKSLGYVSLEQVSASTHCTDTLALRAHCELGKQTITTLNKYWSINKYTKMNCGHRLKERGDSKVCQSL